MVTAMTKSEETYPKRVIATGNDRNQHAEEGLKDKDAGDVQIEPLLHARKLERRRLLVQRELCG